MALKNVGAQAITTAGGQGPKTVDQNDVIPKSTIGVIASFGEVAFYVSYDPQKSLHPQTFTPNNLEMTYGSRWAQVQIYQGPVDLEYVGRAARTLKMDIVLHEDLLGAHDVKWAIDSFEKAVLEKEVHPFILGDKPIRPARDFKQNGLVLTGFALESYSVKYTVVDSDGRVRAAEATLSLRGY